MAVSSSSVPLHNPPLEQAAVNYKLYATPGMHRFYLSETLEPSETACLLRHQPQFAGKDVLDVGVGAGRTTRYLAPLARRYEAVDYSPDMIAYMKQTMPAISSQIADFRNLNIFQSGSFDFVFATNNVIDNFSREDRLKAMREAHRVLRPGGMFAFSSHNLRHKDAFAGPSMTWSKNPIRLYRNASGFLVSWKNHRRIGKLREIHDDYALLNDCGHSFAIIHYYSAPEAVIAHLQASGFQISTVFDKKGRLVPDFSNTADSSSLTYAAQRLL